VRGARPVRLTRIGKVVGGEGLTGPLYGKLGGGGLEGRERKEQGGVQRETKVWRGGGVQQCRRWLVGRPAMWPRRAQRWISCCAL